MQNLVDLLVLGTIQMFEEFQQAAQSECIVQNNKHFVAI